MALRRLSATIKWSSTWRSRSQSNDKVTQTNDPVPGSIEGMPMAKERFDCSQSLDGPVPAPETSYCLDSTQAKNSIDRIRRFRILVIGRANAGKTTILQRLCNTMDQPEISDGEGRKVDATRVRGSLMRGYHEIEDELVFGSNPRFVFHDSCGFEYGSEEQFQKMKEFVMDRASTPDLNKRIHAIWFCIPLTDSHRMVMTAERRFFDECYTGHVPVIVLLTKADTLELDVIERLEELENTGLTSDEVMERTAEVEREMLNRHLSRVREMLGALRFPPCDFYTLRGMQDENADCTGLLTCTANALSEDGLQKLLISTQQSNLALCIEFAVMKALRKCMECVFDFQEPTKLAAALSSWFPYKDGGEQFGYKGFLGLDFNRYGHRFQFGAVGGVMPELDPHLVPQLNHRSRPISMPTLSPSLRSPMKYVVEHGIGSIIVFEYLYFLLQVNQAHQDDVAKHLTMAVKEYQVSGVQAKVLALIAAAFQEHGENVEVLCPILLGIAKENHMSKKLLG